MRNLSSYIIAILLLGTTSAFHITKTCRRINISMVEGHSVHRVASLHRNRLVGKSFFAWSPNGRFREGAEAINGKVFSKIEAVGKNLFAFFENGNKTESPVVVHVHFGMAGNWAVYINEDAPEPSKTNRLRLEYPGIVADLSAMTVQHGGIDLYHKKRLKLGEDPLRQDADPERLWKKVSKSSKSIGALIMDQSYFTGPGNIYRAEICFKAGIHPNRLGKTLIRQEFDSVWYHTKDLLERGYTTGSILTVDPEEAQALGKPRMRRYIYNTAKCPRCSSPIKSWTIASRTCYACPKCQPLNPNNLEIGETEKIVAPEQDVVPFNSHCARESITTRLFESGPSRLTVKELKEQLNERNVSYASNAKKAELAERLSIEMKANVVTPQIDAEKDLVKMTVKDLKAKLTKRNLGFSAKAKKAELVELLSTDMKPSVVTPELQPEGDPYKMTVKELKAQLTKQGIEYPSNARKATLIQCLLSSEQVEKNTNTRRAIFVSSENAAAEKAAAGESLAVEHIAELAPGQARKARSRGSDSNPAKGKNANPNVVETTSRKSKRARRVHE